MLKPPLPLGSGKPLPWPSGPHVAVKKYKITHTTMVEGSSPSSARTLVPGPASQCDPYLSVSPRSFLPFHPPFRPLHPPTHSLFPHNSNPPQHKNGEENHEAT